MLLKLNAAERNCIWYKLPPFQLTSWRATELDFGELLFLKTAKWFKACKPDNEGSDVCLRFVITDA